MLTHRIRDVCVAKIVRNHGLAITTIDVATLISILRPISEDKGISYLDITKIEKETQYRLCSSPSHVSGRGARWKTNASKQKERCAQQVTKCWKRHSFPGFLGHEDVWQSGRTV